MLIGLLILFTTFVLWPLGSWLQDQLFGTVARRSCGAGWHDRDEFDALVELDIATDGRFDGRFGG
jgi:hypothetical protein